MYKIIYFSILFQSDINHGNFYHTLNYNKTYYVINIVIGLLRFITSENVYVVMYCINLCLASIKGSLYITFKYLLYFVIIMNNIDSGISSTIGVILMVAITVVMAAIIGAMVVGMGGQTEEPAQAGTNYDENTEEVTVTYISSGNVNKTYVKVNGSKLDNSEMSNVGESVTIEANKDSEISIVGVTEEGNEEVIKSESTEYKTLDSGTDPVVKSSPKFLTVYETNSDWNQGTWSYKSESVTIENDKLKINKTDQYKYPQRYNLQTIDVSNTDTVEITTKVTDSGNTNSSLTNSEVQIQFRNESGFQNRKTVASGDGASTDTVTFDVSDSDKLKLKLYHNKRGAWYHMDSLKITEG